MRLDQLDLHSPDTFVPGVPHDAFRRLRAEAPVYFHRERGGPGYWAITRYDEVVAISKDPQRFSSWRGGTNIEDYGDDVSVIRMLMLNMDPPQHGKFRRLVSLGFTPRIVAQLEPRIRAATDDILNRVAREGGCDFVASIAAELPLQVIAELMGIPYEDRHKVFDWSNRLIGFDDPEFGTSLEDAKVAAMEMWMYAHKLANLRKDQKGTDLVSVLMNGEVDGARLSEEEFDSFFLLLAVAGNETTRNLISGGMLALIEHPEERARLLANPALLPTAVEEMLRWVTPVMYFRRTATRDTEIRGQKIKEDDKVVMYYPSANRDENVFSNGDRFDVGRTPNEHLTFGVGEHFCLGSSLARLEIRVIFEQLLKRFPDMELAGPVARLRSNFINGYKRMPVRFTPERLSDVALSAFSGYPKGWFVVCFSADLEPGAVKPLHYFGRELVAYRTAEGEARVLDAYCPHLGAHLGHGGKVMEDGCIRCPFHAWEFDAQGDCAKIPYAKKIPPGAKIKAWRVHEINGMVLVHFDPHGGEPSFAIAPIPEYGSDAWLPWATGIYHIKTHPREIVDNLADRAHFPAIHKTEIDDFGFEVDGVRATQHVKGRAILPDGGVDNFSSKTTYHGPGYLLMRMDGALQNYMLVTHTPVDEGNVDLRLAVMLKIVGNKERTEGYVGRYLENLRQGFEDDLKMWEHKVFREQPLLCDGDGPIGKLRRWYRQFYEA